MRKVNLITWELIKKEWSHEDFNNLPKGTVINFVSVTALDTTVKTILSR